MNFILIFKHGGVVIKHKCGLGILISYNISVHKHNPVLPILFCSLC